MKGTKVLNAVDALFPKGEVMTQIQFRKFLGDYENRADVEFPSFKQIAKIHRDFDYEEMIMNKMAVDRYPEVKEFKN